MRNLRSNVNTGKFDKRQLKLSSTDDGTEPRVYAERARQSWKSGPQLAEARFGQLRRHRELLGTTVSGNIHELTNGDRSGPAHWRPERWIWLLLLYVRGTLACRARFRCQIVETRMRAGEAVTNGCTQCFDNAGSPIGNPWSVNSIGTQRGEESHGLPGPVKKTWLSTSSRRRTIR